MSRLYEAAGTHLLADFHGVEPDRLACAQTLERQLRAAALAAGATILSSHFHRFGEGQGVTGVLLLAESHMTVHTWPEHGFAAVDIFMCGQAAPQRALAVLRTAIAAQAVTVETVARGATSRAQAAGDKSA